jgi:photosystem II stability/assembly factor-like uncharacterized protein
MSQNPSRINAPLNFRTSDTLITTKVPHYPTKVDTGTQIVPGWNRPNANGLNSNIISSDYNGPNFKARPLKHWRRQLRSYNGSDPCISSLNMWLKTQSNLDPGNSFLFVSASSDGTKAVGGGGVLSLKGLWYTTDSGKTWNQSTYSSSGLKINTGIYNVSMSSDGTYAVAGCYIGISSLTDYEGILYSNNGGQTWTQVQPNHFHSNLYQYICISGDGKTAIAGSNSKLNGDPVDYGISYSNDSGQTWAASVLISSTLQFNNVCISYDGKNAIAIQVIDGTSPQYVLYYSVNSGVNWALSGTSPQISITNSINHISISKYGLKAIAATSTQGLYYSTDGGGSFTQSNINIGEYYYTSLSDNGLKAIACGDGGIWYSSNGGQTWTNGSPSSSYIAVISGDGKKAIAGISTSNSGLLYSNNGGAYWKQVSTNTAGSFSSAKYYNNMVINNNGTRAIAGGTGGANVSANGMWYSICTDYYNYNKFTSNRTVTISELERPGVTVYHYNPVCECGDEGGNSYIIANNKFGYETKGNQFSEPQNDVQIQNNGFNTVPYDATEQMIKDPANPAYEVLTGVSNTNCINCSPQNNIIKRSIAFNSQAYFADSYAKQQSRCQTYEQNISTNRVDGIQYSNNNQPLWPSNSPLGSQVVAPVNYTPPRLYSKPCLSQTIYKPNNVAFAKQGAVPGSTRLKKLVSDSVTLNGNSFYSAAAATAANFGKYQGTNIPGNYYVKIKQVVDSCIGTVPNPPILIFVNNTLTSITVSWNTPINNSCPILFYTLTFYPVLSNTPISIIVYPSNNNNNIYTIAGLSSSTYYEISITATNGNGTSDINNILSSNTLFDSQIQILLSPSTYTYTYSPSSINVTVTVTSLNPNTPIVLSLINMQDLSGNVINNVAVLTPTSTNNVYSLVLNNAGSFNVYAQQAGSGIYENSTATSPTITINRFITEIEFTDPNPPSTGTYGTPYTLTNPLITWVQPNSAPPGVTVTYSTSVPTVATFTVPTNPNSITINNAGTFTINASTNLTQNYESTSITTSIITINKGTITLSFQTQFTTPTQFGSPYTIPSIIATNQANNPVTGLTITYSTNNPSIATFTNQNDPNTFKILNAGTFTVSAYSNQTDQYYQSLAIVSTSIQVINVPEVIIFNNPQTFPRSGGTSGEVGLIFAIPGGSWPIGFTDFSSVSITRADISVTISIPSATATINIPSYSNCLSKYVVFGESGTSGFSNSFTQLLNTNPYPASNIGYVYQPASPVPTSPPLNSSFANGATSGVSLTFVFSGGGTNGSPSSYSLNVSTGGIGISQGLVYVQYPSITIDTSPGQSQTGYMTLGWKGVWSTASPNPNIQEIWGISADSSSSTYPTYSPLIASGSPPNHTFYPETTSGTGTPPNEYPYYLGIPKMIAPNY